uniref:Uncharacterized protein n=1 Tax=Fervidobacterium nodosum TaxID=2424 RepID=A0A7C5Y333_9BACT
MRKGGIILVLLVIIAIASIALLTLSQILSNIRTNVTSNVNQAFVESACSNCLEFTIATVKLGMDNLCNLRPDIFKFNDHGAEVKNELKNLSVFSKTKEFIDSYVDENNATIIYSYERNSTGSARRGLNSTDFQTLGLMEIYNEFIRFVDLAELDKVYCAVYQIKGGGCYLLLSKIRKADKEIAQLAVVTSERLNKFIYYSEAEPEIYFTSREVIYGPLKSNSYIHTYQYSWTPDSKPTFMGTVEVPGVKHKDETTGSFTIYDANNNPNGVLNALSLMGNPPIKFVNSDVSFSVLYNDYVNAISNIAVDLNTFLNTNFSGASSKPVGVKLPSYAILESKIESGKNILKITLSGGNVYEFIWDLNSLPNATVRYVENGNTVEKNVKFNGLITSDNDITIEDSSQTLQNKLFLYNGNLTIFSKANIWVNARIVPQNIYNYITSQFGNLNNPIPKDRISDLINFVTQNEKSSLDLVANSKVFIKSNGTANDRINNQKIFANIYAFQGSFGVQNHDKGGENGQLLVYGSIMQKQRAAIGLVGAGAPGYSKFYVHDPRALTGKIGTIATPAKKQSIMVLYLETTSNVLASNSR